MAESKNLIEKHVDNSVSAIVARDTGETMVWFKKLKYATPVENEEICRDIMKAYEKQHKVICKRMGVK